MPEQVAEEEVVATVFVNDMDGEREVRLEAGQDFTTSSDGPVSIHIETHSPDDDD